MKILKCTCKHEFQDSLYGAGNRAMNDMKSGQFRCTVCGTVHGSTSSSTPTQISKPVATKSEKPVVKETPKKVIDKKIGGKSTEKKPKEKKTSMKGGKR
jgi:hypothetical protein